MIIFQKIKWRNFLSTGNTFTEINLNDTPNALIIGENGAGKSTILDALTFVLFGKPFRKINKPNLVNAVNEKNCVVEIEFSTSNKQYKIIRGIKPNIFEIWCDNVFLNKDSASKDYQEYLEKFILKMGYKSFCQIVILGSASFVPFMQLTPADRRIIIEDLLDIQVFSVMSNIAKQKSINNKEQIEYNRVAISGKEEKKKYIEKSIQTLKQNNEHRKQELKKRYIEQKTIADSLINDIQALTEQKTILMTDASSIDVVRKRHAKLTKMLTKIESNRCKHQTEQNFYDDNNNCPTCQQEISVDFKTAKVSQIKSKLNEFDDGIIKIGKEIDLCLNEITRINEILNQVSIIEKEIYTKNAQLKSTIDTQAVLINDVDKIDNSDTLLTTSMSELETVIHDLQKLGQERQELLDEKMYIDTACNLLKDGGIKTKIIKQYLPIINKMINKYLTQMGFFASFHINESFEETIKARHLEEFSYQNFSEGEKTRIDLAILFTWRYIAKMRNSVNCNLLIFDEIFDGSLDANGTDEFLKIMWNLVSDTNTFVISHKQDQLVDKFKKVYRFEKRKNYSCIVF
jgi:DNA repair exonuclease SbcCD ATPase subunit